MKHARAVWFLISLIALCATLLQSYNQGNAGQESKKKAESKKKRKITYRRTGDDQPITIAGGSLYLGSSKGRFDSDGADVLKHSEWRRYVTNIEITDKDGKTIKPAYDPAKCLKLTYCKYKDRGCDGANTETITLSTDMYRQNLKLTSDKHGIGHPLPLGSQLQEHPRRKWTLWKIAYEGYAPSECGSDGDCSLYIHYCDIPNGCPPH